MPRIRTIKPTFFRHELLQELEVSHGHLRPMLVFAALWGHCDSEGRFEWRPRTLKLDILPFIDFQLEETLQLLQMHGFLYQYQVGTRLYGVISTFTKHQRISGKECTDGEKYPAPLATRKKKTAVGAQHQQPRVHGDSGEAIEKRWRSTEDISGKQLRRQEQEQEQEGKWKRRKTLRGAKRFARAA